MTTATEELVYRYLSASSLHDDGRRLELDLATSGGCGPNPWLAEGFVRSPQTAARAWLLVANVAAARFWTPPNMVAAAIEAADPVVTTSRDALRFESFSRCCGVYARFDMDAAALDGVVHSHGTTNVDVNPPLRAALARIGPRDPLHLRIGYDELSVSTLDGRFGEKRVPLPERWVRGFAEVAIATSTVEPTLELSNAGLRQFLQQLPRGESRGVRWVVPSGTGARLSTRHAPGGLAVGGIERLRVLREMAPFIRAVTAFGRQGGPARQGRSCSVWSVEIEGGRLTLALSPEPSRGFSGEGGLLYASSNAVDAKVEAAAAGRLGYDVQRAEWFSRELPFSRRTLDRPDGRLAKARDLVASKAVMLTDSAHAAAVASGSNEYRVRLVDGTWRCTCPWWAKHGDDRGPCKHILATVIASTRD
jgi:hypothetical protein